MNKLILIIIMFCSAVSLNAQQGELTLQDIDHSLLKETSSTSDLFDRDERTIFETYPFGKSWLRGKLGGVRAVSSITLKSEQALNGIYLFYSQLPIETSSIENLLSTSLVQYVYIDTDDNDITVPINQMVYSVGVFAADFHQAINLTEVIITGHGGDGGDGGNGTGPGEEICGDGIDNDGNGLIDCEDVPCGIGYVDVIASENMICVGAMNGFQISIDGGMTFDNSLSEFGQYICFDDLADGVYTIVVRNEYGCEFTWGDVEVEVRGSPLSDLGQEIHDAIVENCANLEDDYPCDEILTGDNVFVQMFIDGPQIYDKVKDMISQAEHEVDMAFWNTETGSGVWTKIVEGLTTNAESRSNTIPLRFVKGHEDNINDFGFPQIVFDRFDITFEDYSAVPNGNIHEKVIVVDGKKMMITDANPEGNIDYPAPAWRAVGYYIEGEAAIQAMDHIDYYLPDVPNRDWLNSVVVQQGNNNLLYAGRKRGTDVTAPQNVAWTTIMNNASNYINIVTPNTGAEDFENLAAAAVLNDTKVNLLIPRGFNYSVYQNWAGGGYDRESITEIRRAIRAVDPSKMGNLDLRFFSHNGVKEVIGNTDFACHAKYMSADGQVAMFGSGNQDAFSWNWSDEQNFVADDQGVTAQIDGTFFTPDFENAISSYIEFYEGNQPDFQDIVAIVNSTYNDLTTFDQGLSLLLNVNDDARSAVIYNTPAGKRILICDDSECDQDEDFAELIIKQDITEYNLASFETPINDNFITLTPFGDHIDGKVSAVQVLDVDGPSIIFYEGNNATQDVLVELDGNTFATYNFPGSLNDEARSLRLKNVPAGRVYKIYDSSNAEEDDDFTTIVTKQFIADRVIGTFEENINDAEVLVNYCCGGNLDGKVSSFKRKQ